ncbi:MAG: RNA polymerase sigma factor [Coleofasciculus sp. C2-GNP5-27]
MQKVRVCPENLTNRATPKRVDVISFNKVEKKTVFEEEQILLKRLSQGDKTAFWQLWTQHQDYLKRCCLNWMGGNPIDAEEALSRVTLKVWKKLPKHAEKIENLRAWLRRLTYHLCADIHRERKRSAMGVESIEEIAVTGNEDVASSGASPELSILGSELEMYICQAIDNLPPKLRETFILYCYWEMPYTDIAQHLAISNPNVRKRIQKARELLQKQLTPYLSGLENSPRLNSPLPSLKKGEPKEKLKSDQSKSALSDSHIPISAGCIPQSINYKVTATCLVSLSHPWYNSPSLQGWR